MMKYKLSIIIPCYNCTSTLEEALSSVYSQNLITPFEVIMIDDGSTDNTFELISKLAKKYPYISYYAHGINRGGGAARNSGIEKSTGDLIYCLDSDNFFAANSLQKMIDYLVEKKADGVAFSERRFFINKNKKKFNAQFYKLSDQAVSIEDLFSKNPPLLDNFLYTKKSFYKTSGYPENHGFDTQCFELRYISSGNNVYFCPKTTFYHRQAAEKKSYFEREYESGEFSKNMYLIYEEILYLFTPLIRQKIIHFDIFTNSSMGVIDGMLRELFVKDSENFFINDYRSYFHPKGFEQYINEHKDSREITDMFCLCIYYYKQGRYNEALSQCIQLVVRGVDTKIIHFNIFRIITAIAYPSKTKEVEKMVSSIINSLQTKQQEIDINPNIIKRLKNKLLSKINFKTK